MPLHERKSAEIEKIATHWRKKLGIQALNCPDLVVIIKNLHNLIFGFSFKRYLDDEYPNPHEEAGADCDTQTITIRESVWQKLLAGDPRARMTIAHELGHILLRHKGHLSRNSGKNFSEATNFETGVQEREAKKFAPLFLAPTQLCSGCNSALDIAQNFQLSGQASEIRWEEAKRTRRREQGIKRPLPQEVIDFLQEAERRGHKLKPR